MIRSQIKLICKRHFPSSAYNIFACSNRFQQKANLSQFNKFFTKDKDGKTLYYPKYGCSFYEADSYAKKTRKQKSTFPMFSLHHPLTKKVKKMDKKKVNWHLKNIEETEKYKKCESSYNNRED